MSSSTITPYHFPRNWAYEEYIGVEIIPVYDRRLERIDISDIKIPNYTKKSLYVLVKHIGYTHFAQNLQNANITILVDRPTTECCWMRLVTEFYHMWDPREVASTSDVEHYKEFPFFLKMSVLDEAKKQMEDEDALWYWSNKHWKHPDISVKTVTEMMTPGSDERLDYDMWMLNREELPNCELTKEDLAILGLGVEGGYVLEEGDEVLRMIKHNEAGDENGG